nr:MAG TPA: hypothetical protein [Caudoviricetes sp.]
MQVNIFKQRAAFPAVFSFCHIQKSTTHPGISYKISEKLQKNYKTFLKFL